MATTQTSTSQLAPARLALRQRARVLVDRWTNGCAAGLYWALGPRQGESFSILMYHRVCDPAPGVPAPTWNVPPARFRAQLKGLLARGFEPWSLSRLLAAREAGQPIPANAFVVTFDDGYANNLLFAEPILRELGVPATIFLATAFIDSPQRFPFDDWSAAGSAAVPAEAWRPLTRTECEQLLSSGLIEFGAHTHTHQRFAGRTAEFEHDLAECLRVLRDDFGVKAPAFAFPYGEFTTEMLNVVRRAGIRCAVSTVSDRVGPHDSPLAWNRFGVEATDGAATLAAMLGGWHTAAYAARRGALRPWKLLARPSAAPRPAPLAPEPSAAAH